MKRNALTHLRIGEILIFSGIIAWMQLPALAAEKGTLPPALDKNKETHVGVVVIQRDINDVIMRAGNLQMLKALKAAGLDETLKERGPFTVFAPTDEAFTKLPTGMLDDLLKPENKEKLAGILKMHIAPGKMLAADIVKTPTCKTLGGNDLTVKYKQTILTINDAKVLKANLKAKNGVVYVIDKVILPTGENAREESQKKGGNEETKESTTKTKPK